MADREIDFESCPVEWPKNCQISPTQWLFFGGGTPLDPNDPEDVQVGTQLVTKLDTVTQRLTKLTEIPEPMFAH